MYKFYIDSMYLMFKFNSYTITSRNQLNVIYDKDLSIIRPLYYYYMTWVNI